MLTNIPIILGCGEFDSRDKFPGGGISEIRTLENYELELFFENGGVSYINGEAYPIKVGNILLAVPGDRRQSRLHFKCLFIRFNFRDEGLASALKTFPRVINTGNYNKFRQIFDKIIRSYMSFEQSEELLNSALILELIHSIQKEHNSLENASEKNFADKAYSYIDEHYTEPITVEDIANYCNISASYLYKLFAKTKRISPNELITAKRLTLSKKLLAENEMGLSEIAAACGFNSQAYFSYCFKRQFGVSPKVFRKQNTYFE